MDEIEKLLRDRPLVIPRYLFKNYNKLGINSDEFIVLLFVIDMGDNCEYNPEAIASDIDMNKYKIMEIIGSLCEKKIISIDIKENSEGKKGEFISLDMMYKKLLNVFIDKGEVNSFESGDIYSIFEKEFGRPISSMECQIIKSWIDDNFSTELIMEALKEAVYNNANSLKYIETILNSWRKKGYKNKNDVRKAKIKYQESKKDNSEDKDIFFYDWLNDDE